MSGHPWVVVDTNALLLPFTDGTDLEAELTRVVGAHRLAVPASVAAELERLTEGAGARSRAARGAARLLAACHVEPTSLAGDDGVLEAAGRIGAWVVTNDRRLQEECRRRGIRVVASRGAGRLWLPHGGL